MKTVLMKCSTETSLTVWNESLKWIYGLELLLGKRKWLPLLHRLLHGYWSNCTTRALFVKRSYESAARLTTGYASIVLSPLCSSVHRINERNNSHLSSMNRHYLSIRLEHKSLFVWHKNHFDVTSVMTFDTCCLRLFTVIISCYQILNQ